MSPPVARPAPVTLGYVSRPNGLLGAMVAHIDPSMAGVFVRGLELELLPRAGQPMRTRVVSCAAVRGGVRLSLDAIRDRDQAEALVGATIQVDRERLGPLADGEYLDSDLVGLEVATREGKVLGRLVEVIATGANDVYVAHGDDGAEILIPAIAHAVLDVNLEAGRITVAAEALEYTPPSTTKPK